METIEFPWSSRGRVLTPRASFLWGTHKTTFTFHLPWEDSVLQYALSAREAVQCRLQITAISSTDSWLFSAPRLFSGLWRFV